jgi:AcrR family transcriptional regulator
VTLQRLVSVTVRLIDEVGIENVTMERVGKALGTTAMAPYRHVKNKQELLELAADSILAEVVPPPASVGPWQEQLKAMAFTIFDLQDRYPWFSQVLIGRYLREDTETPNVEKARNETLQVLKRAGFGPRSALLAESVFSTVISGLTINAAFRATGHWQHGTDRQARLVDDLEVADPPAPITEQEYRHFVLDTALRGLEQPASDP